MFNFGRLTVCYWFWGCGFYALVCLWLLIVLALNLILLACFVFVVCYGRCCLPFDRCALQWYFVFDLCGLFCLGLDDLWCLWFDCFFVRTLIMLL